MRFIVKKTSWRTRYMNVRMYPRPVERAYLHAIKEEPGKYDRICSTPTYTLVWAININSLQELLDIKRERRRGLVLDASYANIPVLEIYDDYRE